MQKRQFSVTKQMIPSVRKRLLILAVICVVLYALVRYLLGHGALMAPKPNYRQSPGVPVLVMVFYEALCSDSKHFIIKQLLPAFKQAAPLMDIQLVPYGKAQTFTNPDGTYRFDCQHGQTECEGNMYHACAVEAIEDAEARLNVIACMIRDNRTPKEAMHKCAHQFYIENIDLIQKCYDSNHGGELLKLNGEATHALRPAVSFIPTVTLDGGQHRQAAILKDLLGEVCKIAGDTDKAREYCGTQN